MTQQIPEQVGVEVVGSLEGSIGTVTITVPGVTITTSIDSSNPLALPIAAQILANAPDLVGRGLLAIEEGQRDE